MIAEHKTGYMSNAVNFYSCIQKFCRD